MKEKKQNPYGIKTPTTIEECRENLKKYYMTIGDDNLYVQENDMFKIEDFNSFSDIYKNVREVMNRLDVSSPSICPMVTLKKDVIDYMRETDQHISSNGFFEDEDNFTIWDNQKEFLKDGVPKWTKLDNQIYREFYMMTLGEFSGYVRNETPSVEPVMVKGK